MNDGEKGKQSVQTASVMPTKRLPGERQISRC